MQKKRAQVKDNHKRLKLSESIDEAEKRKASKLKVIYTKETTKCRL